MNKDEIKYHDVLDAGLISFCKNNLSPNALVILGVFIDSDGTVKVDTEQYAYLVQLYLEIGARTGGEFNGVLDFDLGDGPSAIRPGAETDTLL